MSFDKGEVESDGPDDAIADEAQAVLSGQPTASREQFNLSPITLDKPFFYAVLRLDRIGTILKRLEILPQAEVGALVNLAVLAQAVVIAALVLLVPLAAPGADPDRRKPGVLRAVVYFPALALGFLFIEIYLIEKASFWLGDRTNGFALVLTGMLVFSGLGSLCRGGSGPGRGRAWPWPPGGAGLVRRGPAVAAAGDVGHASIGRSPSARRCCWGRSRRCRWPWGCRFRSD